MVDAERIVALVLTDARNLDVSLLVSAYPYPSSRSESDERRDSGGECVVSYFHADLWEKRGEDNDDGTDDCLRHIVIFDWLLISTSKADWLSRFGRCRLDIFQWFCGRHTRNRAGRSFSCSLGSRSSRS